MSQPYGLASSLLRWEQANRSGRSCSQPDPVGSWCLRANALNCEAYRLIKEHAKDLPLRQQTAGGVRSQKVLLWPVHDVSRAVQGLVGGLVSSLIGQFGLVWFGLV